MNKKKLVILLLILMVLTQSGCSLIPATVELVKVPFTILGKVLDIAKTVVQRAPMPPPGVF